MQPTNTEIKNYLDRVERLQSEITDLREDIKDIWLEAKSKGFNTKLLKQVLKIRKHGVDKFQSESDELDLYLHAAGLIVEKEGN